MQKSNGHSQAIRGPRSRNSFIDLLRFVCAFMVVAIHINFPAPLSLVVIPVTRMAVPFFFVVSGYFLADEDAEKMKQRLNKQVKTIFWLLVVAMAAYFCFELLFALRDGTFAKTLSSLWDWNRWYRFVSVNDTRRFYSPHMWYLAALLYAMVALRLALEYYKLKRLYWSIAIAAFIVPLIVWQRGAGLPLPLVRNFLTVALPCVMAGAWLKRSEPLLRKIPKQWVIALPIACTGLIYLERLLFLRWLGYGSLTFYYSALLLPASLIVLSQRFPGAGARTPFPNWGAKYSLMIYIDHYAIIRLQSEFLPQWLRQSEWYRYLAPVLVFALSWGFAAVWEWGKTKRSARKLSIVN